MFIYEKKLQYPVKIANCNPKLASFIISQYGGPDGELGASLRYLSQRYSMPYPELKGLLTDIGTEELGHLEMIGAPKPGTTISTAMRINPAINRIIPTIINVSIPVSSFPGTRLFRLP